MKTLFFISKVRFEAGGDFESDVTLSFEYVNELFDTYQQAEEQVEVLIGNGENYLQINKVYVKS